MMGTLYGVSTGPGAADTKGSAHFERMPHHSCTPKKGWHESCTAYRAGDGGHEQQGDFAA